MCKSKHKINGSSGLLTNPDENAVTGQIIDVSGTMQYQSASDSRLKENVESIDVELTDEIMEKINLIHNNNPNPSP